jgi:hypothetical protein
VAELVDALDSKSSSARSAGSIPARGTRRLRRPDGHLRDKRAWKGERHLYEFRETETFPELTMSLERGHHQQYRLLTLRLQLDASTNIDEAPQSHGGLLRPSRVRFIAGVSSSIFTIGGFFMGNITNCVVSFAGATVLDNPTDASVFKDLSPELNFTITGGTRHSALVSKKAYKITGNYATRDRTWSNIPCTDTGNPAKFKK